MAKYTYNDIFDASVLQGLENIEKKINNLHLELSKISNIKVDFVGGQNLEKINQQLEKLTAKEKELSAVRKETIQATKKIELEEKQAMAARKKAEKQAEQLNNEKIREKAIMSEYKKQLRDQIKLELQLEKMQKKELKTLKDLQFAVSTLKKQRDRLDLTTSEGVKKYRELNAQIARYNDKIKKADFSVGMFQRNVGNYPFKKLTAGFSDVTKAVGGIGIAFAGFSAAIGGAVSAMSKYVELARHQAIAEQKLATVMRQRTGATRSDIESVKKLAQEQQKLGVIGDEVQLSGAQQLATYVNQTSSIKKLLPALNNLLAQQKGVNATQQDAVNIANVFGKALQGQIGALTRYGITLTDSQKKMLKNGNEMQRTAILAQVITDNVGQMNQSLANTPEGKYKQLQNEMGDYGEEIGKIILPLFVKMEKVLVTAMNAAVMFGKAIQSLIAPHRELRKDEAMFAEATKEVAVQIGNEKNRIDSLLLVARNENISKKERLKAIKELNAISPKYLGNIRLETVNTEKTTEAINDYLDALEKKTKAQIAQQKLQEITAKEFDAQVKLAELNKQYNKQLQTQIELYKQKAYRNQSDLAAIGANTFEQGRLNKKMEEQKKILKTLENQKKEFIQVLNKLGVSYDMLDEKQKKANNVGLEKTKPQNINTPTDELAQFQTEQQQQLLEKQLELQKKYKNDSEKIDLEILKYKKEQLEDLISFTKKYNEKYKTEQLQAQTQIIETTKNIKEKELEIEKKKFQESYDLLQKNDTAILIQMRKQGVKEVEIEKKKTELKIAELEKYYNFLKKTGASASQLQDVDNQLESLKIKLTESNQAATSSSDTSSGDNKGLIDKMLGDKWQDKMKSALNAISGFASQVFDILKNMYDAQIEKINQVIEKSKERQQETEKEIQNTKDELRAEQNTINEKIKLGVAYDTRRKKALQDELKRKEKDLAAEKALQEKKLAERKKIEEKERRMDIIRAEIGTAQAVINALATTKPFALALAMAALATVKGIAQVSKIKTAHFAKGTEYVERGGNPQGQDTIPAMIDEGERIIPRKLNAKIPRKFPNKLIPLAVEQYLLLSTLAGQSEKKLEDEKTTEILEKIAENTGKREIRDANGKLIEEKISNFVTITYK